MGRVHPERARRELLRGLQLAYSGEWGAIRAYLGHYASLPAGADHRRAGGHHRARAAVVTDGQMLPVGGQRRGVRPEDPADVPGVVLRGVEVHIVGDGEGQARRQCRARPQVRSNGIPEGWIREPGGEFGPYGGPHRPPLCRAGDRSASQRVAWRAPGEFVAPTSRRLAPSRSVPPMLAHERGTVERILSARTATPLCELPAPSGVGPSDRE